MGSIMSDNQAIIWSKFYFSFDIDILPAYGIFALDF
jgi:hypothetical protein